MFRIVDEHVFWWPVTVRMPSAETPGVQTEERFEGRFRAMSLDEWRAIDDEGAALARRLDTPGEDRGAILDAIRAADDRLVARVLVGWRDVVGPDGAPLDFSAAACAAACRFGWFRAGVLAAYRKAMGGEEARLKN